MTDRREQIIQRLVAIATTVVARIARNDTTITGKTGNAIVIWDGDEAVDAEAQPMRRRADAPLLVEMTPELRILREEPAADLGTSLNTLRLSVISAVITDALNGGTLATLVGTNGHVRYDGLSTEMMPGRALEGALGVRFNIRYPLIFSEL